MASLRRLVIGAPIETSRMEHERLPKILALPIFASDALSSTAYASEEIMAALLLAGTGLFGLTPALSLAIIVLLCIVVASYRQIVMAYPSGGGAYIVAGDNLGQVPAQVAGASLLVDYILTVAVSASAGVAAIVSLVKGLHPNSNIADYTVWMCLGAVALITVINLRGAKESGVAFAFPAYTFLLIMYGLIGYGLYRYYLGGGLTPVHTAVEMQAARYLNESTNHIEFSKFVGPFLILHAFSSGCTALTGVEAISNGVQAFEEPASKNAATTMTILTVLLGTIFLGISFLAVHANALPPVAILPGSTEILGETVMSQVGRAVFGTGFLFIALQVVTCIILILAANTSFAGFPRLCALQAEDGFLPRQLANIGDRLVYNNGIFILTFFSTLLILVFRGDVHHLIPLYAIGVFLSFTISQAGMVKRWNRLKTPGWKGKALLNGFGCACTFVVMIIFAIVKFKDGAWIVIIVIPALVLLFLKIKSHYRSVAKQLSLEGYRPAQGTRQHVCVLVPDIHRGVIPALQLARSISSDARALHVSIDPKREGRVRKRWTLYSRGLPLTILDSPYRSLTQPIVDYVLRLKAQDPGCTTMIIIPEFEPSGWFAKLLHGHAAVALALKLHFMPGVIVVNVPYHISSFVSVSPEERAREREIARENAAH